MKLLVTFLALALFAVAQTQGFRIRRADDEDPAAPKDGVPADEADVQGRFGLGLLGPAAYSSYSSSQTYSSSVYPGAGHGYGVYGYGGYDGAAYGGLYDTGYDGYAGPYGPVPNVNFQSIGPNGRPAISYESPNFGFYFRDKNAAKDV